MRNRLIVATCAALAAGALAPAAALANANGEGLIGQTDDKTVTFFSLMALVFFTLVVIVGTVLQILLDRRNEEKKAAQRRQRIGW